MHGLVTILGYGAAGRATTAELLKRGSVVRVAQRVRPDDLPPEASFIACDVLDEQSLRRAIDGAKQVVLAVGFPYDARIWRTAWPQTMKNVLHVWRDRRTACVR